MNEPETRAEHIATTQAAAGWGTGHTPGRREGRNPDDPLTLDLRRVPEAWMEGVPSIATEQGQAQQ
jgi:hypothetical protein